MVQPLQSVVKVKHGEDDYHIIHTNLRIKGIFLLTISPIYLTMFPLSNKQIPYLSDLSNMHASYTLRSHN